MHVEHAQADSPKKLELPQELVSALNSGPHKPKISYRVEALQPSLFDRFIEKLLGPRS
jgi:hypothetical protein